MLYYKLREMGYRVFLDFTSLHSGKFTEEIREAIAGCTDFLLLIHPTAFNRCKEENDCFRMEVELALKNGKNIIPIFVNQKDFPENIPGDLMQIKDFNSIHYLPLEYADEMASRLAGHYLTVKPTASDVSQTVPATELPEEDEITQWINLREDQWKKCKVCGSDNVELFDAEGEFQKNLEDLCRFLEGVTYVSLLAISLTLVVLVVPVLREWVLALVAEHCQSLMSLAANEWIPMEMKLLFAVCLPVLVGLVAAQTRNILIKYAEMVALREEEDYYKVQCTCGSCRSSFYTDIPTWNLAKEKAGEEKLGKLGYGILALCIMVMIFFLADIVSTVLHPLITWLAWPVVTALFCGGCLIWVMMEYAKLKNN